MLKNTKKLFSLFQLKKVYTYKDIKADIFNQAVKDVNNYSKILKLCEKSQIIKKYDDNNFDALLEINFGVFKEEYMSRVKCNQYNKGNRKIYDIISETNHDSVIKYLYSRWNFYEENNQLIVNYELQMEMFNQLQQIMVKTMNPIIARQTIQAMIKKAKQLQQDQIQKTQNINQKIFFKKFLIISFQILAQFLKSLFKPLNYNYQLWTFLLYKIPNCFNSFMVRNQRINNLDRRRRIRVRRRQKQIELNLIS